jgi:hypothetical protein
MGWRAFFPGPGAGYASAQGPSYGNSAGMNPQDELRMLRNQADAIKNDLDAISKRIQELESKSAES